MSQGSTNYLALNRNGIWLYIKEKSTGLLGSVGFVIMCIRLCHLCLLCYTIHPISVFININISMEKATVSSRRPVPLRREQRGWVVDEEFPHHHPTGRVRTIGRIKPTKVAFFVNSVHKWDIELISSASVFAFGAIRFSNAYTAASQATQSTGISSTCNNIQVNYRSIMRDLACHHQFSHRWQNCNE